MDYTGKWIQSDGDKFRLYQQILNCIDEEKQEYKYTIWRQARVVDQFGKTIALGDIEQTTITGTWFAKEFNSLLGDQIVESPIIGLQNRIRELETAIRAYLEADEGNSGKEEYYALCNLV